MKLAHTLLKLPQYLEAIQTRLITIDNKLTALEARIEADSRATALLAAGWVARSYALQGVVRHPSSPDAVVEGPSLEEASEKLEVLEPDIFPIWRELHKNDEPSYFDDSEASCSHWNHKYARLFGAFIGLFARGRLLDIGCGINGLPSYLAGYPTSLISGLDPRPSRVRVEFQYVQGFNEFLPWNDATFHTVVSGTSLDHVLSLEKSLEEVGRVLVPGGVYLVWLASLPGARPYEPRAKNFVVADKFHLFHFDRKWIEPLFEKFFEINEVCVIPQPGFDHVFYCLTKKA